MYTHIFIDASLRAYFKAGRRSPCYGKLSILRSFALLFFEAFPRLVGMSPLARKI